MKMPVNKWFQGEPNGTKRVPPEGTRITAAAQLAVTPDPPPQQSPQQTEEKSALNTA